MYHQINAASRMKDTSKIEYYGAFASALGYIIHCGNHSKLSNRSVQKLYRGIRLNEADINSQYKVGGTINLLGFTSTTLSKDLAIKFAFKDIN